MFNKTEALRDKDLERVRILRNRGALVVAAYAFMHARAADRVFTTPPALSAWLSSFPDLVAGAGVLLVCCSLYLALDVSFHLRLRSRAMQKHAPRLRHPYHARETFDEFETPEAFLRWVETASTTTLTGALAHEVWGIYGVHARAFERLRIAAWLLLGSVLALALNGLLVMVASYGWSPFEGLLPRSGDT